MYLLAKKLTFAAVVAVSIVGLISCQQTSQNSTKSNSEQSQIVREKASKQMRIRPSSDGTDPKFVVEIINIALAEIGYNVEKTKIITSAPLLHVAIGNGDVDFSPVHWEKLYEKFFEIGGGSKKLELVGAITNHLLQGYKIDQKTAIKYKITNLAQLKDPNLAKLFDTDGNGKANLVNCPVGWGCDEVVEHHLKVYGLQNTVELDRRSSEIQIVDAIARYKQGESVFYYNWSPSRQDEMLKDVVWLEVPFTSYPESMGNYTKKDTSINGKNLGFAVDRLRIVANKQYLSANPAAERLFELIEIPVEDIAAELKLVYNGEDSPEDIHRHAKEWIEKHQQLFNRWIEEAKAKAVP